MSERTEKSCSGGSTGNLIQAERPNSYLHVALILLAGVLARIPYYLGFRPTWSGDSQGYAEPYALWVHHVFGIGERTPVYPLFLGLVQWIAAAEPGFVLSMRSAYVAILVQSILDIVAAALVYFTLRSLRIHASIALGASLFLATIPGVCNYEMNILNMSFSFFLMALATFLFLKSVNCSKTARGALCAVACGIAFALAVLNRPEMLIFVVILLIFTACLKLQKPSVSQHPARPLKTAAWIAIPVMSAVFVWMFLMYVAVGEFRVTTLDGWNRSRTVYNMFDRVDGDDRVIGEIMSRTYRQQVSTGSSLNIREIMWQAQGELISNYSRYPVVDPNTNIGTFHQETIRVAHKILGLVEVPCEGKLNDYCWEGIRIKINTGDYLGKVSWKLARKYPRDWLHNVTSNFLQESFNFSYVDSRAAIVDFDADAPDGSGILKNDRAAKLTVAATRLHAPLLLLTYMVTLACSILSPLILFRKQDEHWLQDAAVTSLAVASVGTILGTCVLAGYNRVYSLPHLVVFVICTAYAWENSPRIAAAVSGRIVGSVGASTRVQGIPPLTAVVQVWIAASSFVHRLASRRTTRS
jgi:hypothetical protein